MGIWIEKVLDLIYPKLPICVSCLREIEGSYICDSCLSDINLNKDFDRKTFENFDAMYVSYYSGSIKNIIYNFKVHKNFYCGEYLNNMMCFYLKKNSLEFDYVTYVPRDNKKIKKDGFDQSYFMSKLLSRKLNIPFIKLLYCTGKKFDQKHMGIHERIFNVKNKFFVRNFDIGKLEDKKVLIIDDVATTYSTLNEVVDVIRKTSFKIHISVLTIAKTLI